MLPPYEPIELVEQLNKVFKGNLYKLTKSFSHIFENKHEKLVCVIQNSHNYFSKNVTQTYELHVIHLLNKCSMWSNKASKNLSVSKRNFTKPLTVVLTKNPIVLMIILIKNETRLLNKSPSPKNSMTTYTYKTT
jgi:hypothetical protein